MNFEDFLILREQFRKKHDELRLLREKVKHLAREDRKLNAACSTAMFNLSKEDRVKFEKIHEKEAEELIEKFGSKLWTS
jgi:hypothetical protein